MKKCLALLPLAAGAVLLATSAAASAAPTVADGSFESPLTGGYDYGTPGDGATFTSGAGVAANGSAFGYADAVDGNQVAHLQGTGSANLDVSGLVVGQSYDFSFYYAARPSYDALTLTVSYDGDVLGTYTPASDNFAQVTTSTFVATSSTGTLSFTGTNDPVVQDLNAGLDAVTINDAVSAAPEPGTWCLMLGGVGAMGLMLRRRRTAGAVA